MNYRIKIQQQISNIGLWPRRIKLLSLVLIFSILLIALSFTYEPGTDSGNEWVYAGAGIAICLIAGVFFLLLGEISLHKKLIEELQVQKDNYFTETGRKSEVPVITSKEGEMSYPNNDAETLSGWSIAHAKNILGENEKQYQTLIQSLPGALYTCDERGYIKLYNTAAVELWGKKPDAGKDRWCGALKTYNTDGTALQPDSGPMALTLKERRAVQGKEIIIQRLNGKFRHVLTYSSPIFNTDGKLSGAVNIMVDITDKRESEILVKHSEAKYKTLIELAPDAIFVHDHEGKILEANDSGVSLLGFTIKELLSMNIKDVYSEAELVARPIVYKELFTGDQTRIERNMQHRNGSQIPVEISIKKLPDMRIIAIARDISEIQKKQKMLAESEIGFRTLVMPEQNINNEKINERLYKIISGNTFNGFV